MGESSTSGFGHQVLRPPTQLFMNTRAGTFVSLACAALVFGICAMVSRPVAEYVLAATLLVSAGSAFYRQRRGLMMFGVKFLPVMIGFFALVHVAEGLTRARPDWRGSVAMSDLMYLATIPLAIIVVQRGYFQLNLKFDRLSAARQLLDSMLVTVGVLVAYGLTLFHSDGAAPPVGSGQQTAMMLHISLACMVFAPTLFRAVEFRDAGSRWLAISCGLFAVGTVLWTYFLVFARDTPAFGVGLIAASVALHPKMLSYSTEQRRMTLRPTPETMIPLFAMLLGWGIAVPHLAGHLVRSETLVMAVISVVLIVLRFWVVRTSERRLFDRLSNLVYTDTLTSLGNRRAVSERLEQTAGWLITLDLDRFKEVNDRFGHEAGDNLLRQFAAQLESMAPQGSSVARLGGDEFVICLPDVRKRDAMDVASRIVTSASNVQYARIGVSAGVAPYTLESDAGTALRDSDIALQSAKQQGRGRVVLLDNHLRRRRIRDLAITEALADGTVVKNLTVAYQPIVRLSDDQVIAAEVLARWEDPVLGQVSPAEFIPLAEQSGVIEHIGLAVVKQALGQLAQWWNDGYLMMVSVNLSLVQLQSPRAVDDLGEAITNAGPHARRLVLEITESTFLFDDDIARAVARLRALGPMIAIDDFGTGAATLARLRAMPVDILKLDRALAIGPGDHPAGRTLVKSMVDLAHQLGLTSVLEGIEDAETMAIARRLRVSLAQGFFCGRPGPATAIIPSHTVEREAEWDANAEKGQRRRRELWPDGPHSMDLQQQL